MKAQAKKPAMSWPIPGCGVRMALGRWICSAVGLWHWEVTSWVWVRDGDRLTPPACHQREHPLPAAREVLQKHGCVEYQIAPAAKTAQANEKPQNDPIRTAPRDDGKDRAYYQAHVEREPPPDDIRADSCIASKSIVLLSKSERFPSVTTLLVSPKTLTRTHRKLTPKARARKHPYICCNRQPIPPPGVKLQRRLSRDDTLNQQDQAINGISEAVQNEEFPLVGREANFVNGIVDKVHFGVEYGVGVLEGEDVALSTVSTKSREGGIIRRWGGAPFGGRAAEEGKLHVLTFPKDAPSYSARSTSATCAVAPSSPSLFFSGTLTILGRYVSRHVAFDVPAARSIPRVHSLPSCLVDGSYAAPIPPSCVLSVCSLSTFYKYLLDRRRPSERIHFCASKLCRYQKSNKLHKSFAIHITAHKQAREVRIL